MVPRSFRLSEGCHRSVLDPDRTDGVQDRRALCEEAGQAEKIRLTAYPEKEQFHGDDRKQGPGDVRPEGP